MRHQLITLLLLISPFFGYASPLQNLSDAIEALGKYEVHFSIEVNEEPLGDGGRYVVDGTKFLLSISETDLYGDGAERCSVNHFEREVFLERLSDEDTSAQILVADPSIAFTDLDSAFDSEIISQSTDTLRLHLTPKGDDSMLDSALLELDATTHLPRRVIYYAEGDVIAVDIERILTDVDIDIQAVYPPTYDVIDIR